MNTPRFMINLIVGMSLLVLAFNGIQEGRDVTSATVVRVEGITGQVQMFQQ